jgi:hypothetical protein
MRDCRRRPLAAIIADMQQRGLLNVDGEFAEFPDPPDRNSAKGRTPILPWHGRQVFKSPSQPNSNSSILHIIYILLYTI